MQTIRIAGRRYTDPDILSLVGETGELVDPRSAVIHQARKLNENLRQFDGIPKSGLERMKVLASLRRITVEPMDVERQRNEPRDAILVTTAKGRIILYNPRRPATRVAFSIGHEITHTFFPNSVTGARFRNICESSSKEANELERLCDLGASELLMPIDEFRAAAAGKYSLAKAEDLANLFGSSFEATVYRLATAHPTFAVSGLLQFRQRREEQRRAQNAGRQTLLFQGLTTSDFTAAPKYRRQSCHLSEQCGAGFTIRWNKSFDSSSIVYLASHDSVVHASIEVLPNETGLTGKLEAIRAPYQRDDAHPEHPDVLFLWVADQF